MADRVDRVCPRCGKEFILPNRLRRHLDRKTPCAPILLPNIAHKNPDLQKKRCRFCGRDFSSYSSRWRHEKNSCKINRSEEGMDLLYEHTKRNQELVSRKDQQLVRQEQMIALQSRQIEQLMSACMRVQIAPAAPSPAQATVAIQGDYAQVDNSNKPVINQTINVFGRERMDHISQSQVYSLLMKTQGLALPDAAAQSVLEAALLIYSDSAHPENITCYLPNKKTNKALVHGDHGWNIQPVDLVLTPMMQKSVDVLFAKQPFGAEEGLPKEPNISACGAVLKGLMEFEKDPTQRRRMAGKDGQLRAVLVRNKDELSRALNTLPLAGSQHNLEPPAPAEQK